MAKVWVLTKTTINGHVQTNVFDNQPDVETLKEITGIPEKRILEFLRKGELMNSPWFYYLSELEVTKIKKQREK